jgi:serine/threonine protein kinase
MPDRATGVREGEVFAGKYLMGEVLGAGAMGTVVAGHHLLLDQKVAIKFLTTQASAHPEALGRFMQEARAAVRIKSEHVVRVRDVAVENDLPYIVMEYLEGCDLAEWMRRHGPLSVERAIDFILQACEAIHEAHGLDIIHRDIKPPNLFAVQRSGVIQTIKVLDFGISKTLGIVPATLDPTEWEPESVVTQDRTMIGSPYYMSPEQMESARDVDARTDVWALGVTLYELLSGKLPFEGRSLLQVYSHIASNVPLRLRDGSPHVPSELEAIILKCLERQRDRRCGSVAELAAALVRFGSSRATLSIERIASLPGPRETTAPASPLNEPSTLRVLSSAAIDRTLASPIRLSPLPETKNGEVTHDKAKPGRGLRVAAVAAGLLAVALGTGLLLPRVLPGGGGGSASVARALVVAAPPAARASDSAKPDGEARGLGASLAVDAGTWALPSTADSFAPPLQVASTAPMKRVPVSPHPGLKAVMGAPSSEKPSSRVLALDAALSPASEWTPPEIPR